MDIDSWKGVTGWLSEAEGAKLQELAHGKRVLELGSYRGRSTVCMALVAELVIAVDWHRGGYDIGFGDTLPEFMSNIRAHGVEDRVVPMICRHGGVKGFLRNDWFGLVFVDGDHTREGVLRDSGTASWLTKYDGAIAFHDFGHEKYPDVKDVVESVFRNHTIEIVETLAVVRS